MRRTKSTWAKAASAAQQRNGAPRPPARGQPPLRPDHTRNSASTSASTPPPTPPPPSDAHTKPTQSQKTTHFGFATVPEDDKQNLVKNVFENVAPKYDLMNDLMSAGMHRLWKKAFVDLIGLGPMRKPNLAVLDVAGGTGDISFSIADQLERLTPVATDDDAAAQPRIVVCDVNKAMLDEGRKRAEASRRDHLEWVVGNAEQLPFDDGSFDVYTIAFGIRNVTRIDEALREAHRVLRPGGRFLCLEFSKVTNPVLRTLYERYSFDVIPKIGQVVANDAASYQYLVESIQKFDDQETLAHRMRRAGLRCVSYTNLTGGVVAIHSAIKL